MQRLAAAIARPLNVGTFFSGSELKPVRLAYWSCELASRQTRQPTLLVMHEILSCKAAWTSIARRIQARTNMKIIAPDARNHGDSPHSDQFSYQHMVEDTRALLEDLGVEKVSVLGHGMGGRAAMLLALTYPKLVDKLIVVEASPTTTASTATNRNVIEAMKAVPIQADIPILKARKIAEIYFSKIIHSRIIRRFLLANLIQCNGGKCKWRVNLDTIQRNLQQIDSFPNSSGVFMGQTYFIGGRLSDIIRPEEQTDIKRLFPMANISYIDGAGHWLQTEKPNIFMDIVCGLLNNKSNVPAVVPEQKHA